jgi:hypothetical protein
VNARTLLLCLLGVTCFGPAATTQQSKEAPGKLEIAKHPLVLESPLGPQAQKLDPAKLREEAGELSKLAQSIPENVDQIAQGKFPKDLPDKLKRIEKISKHLRAELTP